ncbi:hypothetical phage protein [Escherichia phage phiEcoM-GJ1]|uniref:Hypothetical phage protein n=1 Tax=Escherichia phage phiEcoM-GJ1 TaxID=451705 RepID=A9Q1Q7_9CAUD|nr:hypothetical protein phiEcoMGJ1_gp04 [Escherichia phage phiEcoM-GJ1]ABR68716.1 hypothetical phage protein [Escherichia phage phiEcoM-GJ1]
MNYALYHYISRTGLVRHALVNIKTKDVMLADMSIYGNNLVWKRAANPSHVWLVIQSDKYHKIVAMANRPEHIVPRK